MFTRVMFTITLFLSTQIFKDTISSDYWIALLCHQPYHIEFWLNKIVYKVVRAMIIKSEISLIFIISCSIL